MRSTCWPAAENESHEGKRRVESQWPIFKLHHQRSRYVFDIYYKRKIISKELYEFLLEQGYADAALIAKWKKVRAGRRPRLARALWAACSGC